MQKKSAKLLVLYFRIRKTILRNNSTISFIAVLQSPVFLVLYCQVLLLNLHSMYVSFQVKNLEDNPNIFFCLDKQVIPKKLKRVFLFYLARDMPERTPYSVFRRFKLLLGQQKKGRYLHFFFVCSDVFLNLCMIIDLRRKKMKPSAK